MAGKSGQTIGFHYLMSVFSGMVRGPINEMCEIEADDKQAWFGSAVDDTPHKINKPNLFGGEKREGGIQGAFRLFQGARDQVLPASVTVTAIGATGPVQTTTIKALSELIPTPISQMRGFVSMIFDGLVASMSPYPKAWKMRMRRWDAGWANDTCWYPEKALISMIGDGTYNDDSRTYVTNIRAMNPAHIIYQCLTDPEWGAGESTASIDENSFIAAANRLCSEAFGLCFLWTRQEDVRSFIKIVIDHIGAVLYNDRETGKFVLRLVRDDYDVEDLPLYTYSTGLLRVESDESASSDEAINELIVTGHDPVINKKFEIRVQNRGGFRESGEVVSDSVEYKGAPTRALAIRLGMRELRMQATGLKRYKLAFDRRAWKIAPGMPIRISVPSRSLNDIVVRLGEIDYGALDRGIISAVAIEDVFSLPETSFTAIPENTWTPPSRQAVPATATRLVEASYRDIYLRGGNSAMADVEPEAAYIGQLAAAPDPAMPGYDLLSMAAGDSDFTSTSDHVFTGTALLAADVTALATVLTVTNAQDLDAANVGQALLLGDELVEFVSIDGLDVTVRRGCGDTVPTAHAAGDRLWTIDDDLASDNREYADGEDVTTKVLTRTTSDLLDPAEATFEILTLVARHFLPYPPGNVTINTVPAYDAVGTIAEPEFDWSHRDRIVQADQLVAFEDGSVGPEAGVEYRLRFYSVPGDVLLRTETTAGTTFTYDATMQAADVPGVKVRVLIDSERDGLYSYQAHNLIVQLSGGYGYNYGRDYGGAP